MGGSTSARKPSRRARTRDWFAERALGLGLAAALFTPVAAIAASLLPGWWKAAPVVVQVVLASLAFLIPAAKSEKSEERADTAEEERDKVRTEMRLVMTDVLRPFVTEVVSAVDPAGATTPPGTTSAESVSTVLAAAVKLCGDGEASGSRTRACWYRLDENESTGRSFVPTKHFGRGAKPRTIFDVDQSRGHALLDLVRNDTTELWTDLGKQKPPSWQPGATDNEYETFLVVPVRTLARQFGLITVDATEANLLDHADVEVVHTLANVFALALSHDSDPATGEPGTAG